MAGLGLWVLGDGFLGRDGTGCGGLSTGGIGGLVVKFKWDMVLRSWLSLSANSVTVPSRWETWSSSMMERKESTDDGLSGEGGVSDLEGSESV